MKISDFYQLVNFLKVSVRRNNEFTWNFINKNFKKSNTKSQVLYKNISQVIILYAAAAEVQ